MREKETASGVATTRDGRERQIFEEKLISDPNTDNTTVRKTGQGFVSQFLKRGEENAIHASDLALLCGYEDTRQPRNEVEQERISGRVMLSGNKGYFLPEIGEDGLLNEKGYMETKAHYSRRRSYGIAVLRSAKYARLALLEYEDRNNIHDKI